MAYRDDLAALQARHDALVAETSRLERELDQTVAKLPVLPSIRVASPCTEPWSGMEGDARIRSCAKCNQFVYNLSEMTRDEAEALISTRDGRVCVRFFQRRDGTILLADCEVRRSSVRHRRLATAGLAAALTAGAGYSAIASPGNRDLYVDISDVTGLEVGTVMGDAAPPPRGEVADVPADDFCTSFEPYDPFDEITGTPPLTQATPPPPEFPLETHYREPGLIEDHPRAPIHGIQVPLKL